MDHGVDSDSLKGRPQQEGKDQYSWSLPVVCGGVEELMKYLQMSFSGGGCNKSQHRKRCTGTRPRYPIRGAQHSTSSNQQPGPGQRGEGSLATGSSLQASGTPAGCRGHTCGHSEAATPHPWGPRGEDQPWVDTAG
ncbi:hypothetical protein BDA96_04G071100 [Sorghum bicolor]|nr:hypothetical protein BDA96_04G071100 [Sorghum bicolor]